MNKVYYYCYYYYYTDKKSKKIKNQTFSIDQVIFRVERLSTTCTFYNYASGDSRWEQFSYVRMDLFFQTGAPLFCACEKIGPYKVFTNLKNGLDSRVGDGQVQSH